MLEWSGDSSTPRLWVGMVVCFYRNLHVHNACISCIIWSITMLLFIELSLMPFPPQPVPAWICTGRPCSLQSSKSFSWGPSPETSEIHTWSGTQRLCEHFTRRPWEDWRKKYVFWLMLHIAALSSKARPVPLLLCDHCCCAKIAFHGTSQPSECNWGHMSAHNGNWCRKPNHQICLPCSLDR